MNKVIHGLPECFEELRQERAALHEFVRAIKKGDIDSMNQSLAKLQYGITYNWRSAFRRAAKLAEIPMSVRREFKRVWISHGDTFRDAMRADPILTDGLRAMLPPYRGAGLVLYRGDSLWNHERGTYGFSWSSRKAVGRGFAMGIWRVHKGGSVLLKTTAQANAIIARGSSDEAEYIVDPRRLKTVNVLDRFSELSFDEYNRQQRQTERAR